MEKEIINKVANSGLVTLDLEEFYPEGERIGIDLKDMLFMEQILKEKDFRAYLKEQNWEDYKNKNVYIYCTVDAIIPTWAYMLLTIQLSPYVNALVVGNLKDLNNKLYGIALDKIDFDSFKDARVVIKGCSKKDVPLDVYAQISKTLVPIAKSIMFGEPCSTVPLYKKRK